MISEQAFKDAAARLRVDVAAVKAVSQVESGKNGIIAKRPVILFEPHVFWKELKKVGIDPLKFATKTVNVKGKLIPVDNPGYPILYPTWGALPYDYGQPAQYDKMDKASKISREAALQSASWGKFQILGNNWRMTGARTLQEFVNDMYRSEEDQLNGFVNYIIAAGLDDEMRYHDWKGFARGYNGPEYWRNSYDTKLEKAYKSFL